MNRPYAADCHGCYRALPHYHSVFLSSCCCVQPFREAIDAVPAGGSFVKTAGASTSVEAAVAEGYKQSDENLLRLCAEKGYDYSSCTSVTAIITGDLLTVAHLGDSKIVLGREGPGGVLVGKYLTLDHKPDMPEERARIERVSCFAADRPRERLAGCCCVVVTDISWFLLL